MLETDNEQDWRWCRLPNGVLIKVIQNEQLHRILSDTPYVPWKEDADGVLLYPEEPK